MVVMVIADLSVSGSPSIVSLLSKCDILAA